MRNLLIIMIFLVTTFSNAKNIFIVKYPFQADIKVFVTKYCWDADLFVFQVNHKYEEKGKDEFWYYVNYDHQSNLKIYFVDEPKKADLNIFFVKYKFQAGWNKLGLTNILKNDK